MIPPRTILAATDFSDASKTALIFAARLARHCEATLHVVYAEHPLLSAAAEQNGINLASETRDELQRTIAAAPPAIDSGPHLHTFAGPAVDVILDVARRQHADLIVVGSRGMSGTERLVFGSTTEGVLRRSTVPVLVVPAEWAPPRTDAVDLAGAGPIIAGVDMTAESLAAARAACAVAQSLGTTLELFHVVPELAVPVRWLPHATRALADRLEQARSELDGVVRNLACAAATTTSVDTGPVADRLASVAGRAADRAPLLVLGKKAPHSGGGAPGATAYRVLSLAKVPVLMVVA